MAAELPAGIDPAQLFALLAQHSHEGVLLFDGAGTVLYFNHEAQRQRGYLKVGVTLSQLASQNTFTDRDGRPLTATSIPIAVALGGKVLVGARWVVKRPDGTSQFLGGSAWPMKDERGAVQFVLATTYDETDELRTRDVNQRLRDQAQVIAEVAAALAGEIPLREMLSLICQTLVLRLDAAIARVWLSSDDGLLLVAAAGMPTEEVLAPARIAAIAGSGRAHFGNDAATDPELKTIEGMHSFAGCPLQVGASTLGVLAMYSREPLTEDIRATLTAIAAALSVGVARKHQEHARSLLIAQLERKNAELNQFAYVVSHDLKAPLRGMGVLSEMLEEDAGARLLPEEREKLAQIRTRSHKLQALIDGVLEYSRAGREFGPLEKIDLGELLREAVTLLSPRASARIELPEEPILIETHKVPLQQVAMNLITNALTHAGRDDVTVRVSVARTPGQLTLTVSDDGQGIAPEHHARVWAVFARLDARAEGTGIGLAVVKKVVEARGGTVSLTSAAGAGATFDIVWPERAA